MAFDDKLSVIVYWLGWAMMPAGIALLGGHFLFDAPVGWALLGGTILLFGGIFVFTEKYLAD